MDLDHSDLIEIAKDIPLIQMPLRVDVIKKRNGSLASYSIFRHLPLDILRDALQCDKGPGSHITGTLVGFAIADSVAAPWKHTPVGEAVRGIGTASSFYSLETGQYTDITSIALCLAESLIVREGYEPTDARGRYYHWWHSGYMSSLGEDKTSEGLRPVLGRCFTEILAEPNAYVVQKSDELDAGSLVGAIVPPLYFHRHPEYAIAVAQHQSYGRQGGEVAAACCATLSFLLMKLLQPSELSREASGFRKIVDDALSEWQVWMETQIFPHPAREGKDAEEKRERALEVIGALVTGEGELSWKAETLGLEAYIEKVGKPAHTIGQTAPEALSMSLHAAYHATSYMEAVQRAVAMGGDSNMVAALAGSLWGAYVGYHSMLKDTEVSTWKKELEIWDKERITALGTLLYTRGSDAGFQRGVPTPHAGLL